MSTPPQSLELLHSISDIHTSHKSLKSDDKIYIFVAGAHVCQPEHRRMCVGSSCGGPCQEDGRQSVVGAVRSKHRQVSRDDGIQYSQFRIQLNATLFAWKDQQTQG